MRQRGVYLTPLRWPNDGILASLHTMQYSQLGSNFARNCFKTSQTTLQGVRMDQNATLGEGKGRNTLELVKSITDKHLDLLRPSARWFKDLEKGKYSPIRDEEDSQLGLYDKPLPCFGCGIGWFSFLLGFLFPLMWYYATILYLGSYYRKDPRERSGLAASAIAALSCSVILFIVVMILVF